MNFRIISLAAAGALALAACSGQDDTAKTDAAAMAAEDTSAMAPADTGAMGTTGGAMDGSATGATGATGTTGTTGSTGATTGQTPGTLPTDQPMTSSTTSPPAQ
ncbi:MAG TPA: hypothetical protein VFF48_05660 [Brevundimonas sp.]|nr:hypothetical protein [Brevundimonas sp.]